MFYGVNANGGQLLHTYLVYIVRGDTSEGVGTIRSMGSRCRSFGRDPCSVSRVASLFNCFGLEHIYGKSPGFRNIHPPRWGIPVYVGKIWRDSFSARIFLFCIVRKLQMTDSRQHAERTTLQPCRTAAAVGNIIYVRVACPRCAAASCLCRSLSFVTPPCHTFLPCFRWVRVSIDAETQGPL